jgi:hypothetical protein
MSGGGETSWDAWQQRGMTACRAADAPKRDADGVLQVVRVGVLGKQRH